MVKTFNGINILGFVIGVALGIIDVSHSYISVTADISLIIDVVLRPLGYGIYFYLVANAFIRLFDQKKVVIEYKVKNLKYVPQVRQISKSLSDDQIGISFEDLPQYLIEYDLLLGGQTGPTNIRYAQVLEEKTDGIVLRVTSWEYKHPLQKYLQDLKTPTFVFSVPKGTILTE